MSPRFQLAGITVDVSGVAWADLAGHYAAYPAPAGPAAAVVDVTVDPAFATDRAPAPDYPAFERHPGPDGLIRVTRHDAEGEVRASSTPEEPVSVRLRMRRSQDAADAAIRLAVAFALPARGGLLLHASSVGVGDRAWVFAGQSGAGKSTIARLLSAVRGATVLADEMLVVAGSGKSWHAYAAPFHTRGAVAHARRAALARLCFLRHAPTHELRRLPAAEGLPRLLRNVLTYASDARGADLVLEVGTNLLAAVPCYELAFAPRPDVAAVLGIT
jgi:hypothetical protein